MTPTLKSRRLTLRAPRQADAARVADFLNNFAVAGNLARVPFPYRLSDAKAWLKTRRDTLAPAETSFAIEFEEQGLVGQVGYHLRETGDAVLGYWLAEPFWGRGIMTEAVIATLDWYFAATRAETVVSGVFIFNAPSHAIQHKLGFTETGRSSILCLARGEEVEHIDTELTRRVWSMR